MKTVRSLRPDGSSGPVLLRADSAFYGKPTIGAAVRAGTQVSVTVRMTPNIKAAIATIVDDAWTAIEYTDAIVDERTLDRSTAGTCCSPAAPTWTGCSTRSLTEPGPGWTPTLRTLFGAQERPRSGHGADLSPRQAVVIERPRWDLTIFKVHFGLLTLKSYTKGEHMLRFEAIVHNTRALHCGRMLEKFGDIVTRLAAIVERFTTMLDCVDVSFLPDQTLD